MTAIVVGFDATDQATDALRLGAALASELEARLIVAAVYERPSDGTGGASPAAERDRFFTDAFAAADAHLPGVEYEQRAIGGGVPRASLADLAESEAAELIVIGSSHHGGIGRMLAGTAGRFLFDHFPNGVVVAPRNWMENVDARFRRIGVGYDGTRESELALLHASELAQRLEAKLQLIAVAPYLDPHISASDLGPEDQWVRLLGDGARAVGDRLDVTRVLRQGRPATVLMEESSSLDLLVVGARTGERVKRAVFGSVSSELVRTSACPVLVVSGQARARDSDASRAATAPS